MDFATESKTGNHSEPLTPEELRGHLNAADDLISDFSVMLERLQVWQGKINLVGATTLADPWRRHFLDSAQLGGLVPKTTSAIVDIGSGAGFPGMVLAIMAKHRMIGRQGCHVHLVESDTRKCIFLREINRLTNAGASVHNVRAETYDGPLGDVVTARACAPLRKLMPWARALSTESGRGLFLKGEKLGDELTDAQKDWTMDVMRHPSQSDPRGIILQVENVARNHVH